ncbi:ChAPs (Chs5p-Arf1p-binding proteins) protein [Toxoplasma gondii p89]|uniref:ChAPs (Chs5p-Arf1p-binding proteins) protein n=1 Tax=Toxoplasma gondii p89 TaxID=943119 RepID=A0A086L2F6_TOXGO|nr:ChAPs (Chs5p-Arf1p-binding proteins) protein [Toxoplasma gondii p89]
MSRCIADCREFVDYHGSLLASRDATLIAGEFDGLGPPDLCCLEKVQKDRSLATFFGSTSYDETSFTRAAALFCHYVIGLETSQPAALAAYIYSQVAKQETETSWFGRKWQILGGIYCTFDVFHQVDLRVEVRLPCTPGVKPRFLSACPSASGASPGPGASGAVFCYAFPASSLHPSSVLSHQVSPPGHPRLCGASASTAATSSLLPSSPSDSASHQRASVFSRRKLARDIRDLPQNVWETALLSSMLRAEVPPRIHPCRCLVVLPLFDKPGRSREFVELASRFFASGDDLGLLPSIGQGTNALCEVLAHHVLRTFSLPKIVETLSSLHALSPLVHLHVARAYSKRKMLHLALTIAIRSLRSFPEEACFLRYQAEVLIKKGEEEERKEGNDPSREVCDERRFEIRPEGGEGTASRRGREHVESQSTHMRRHQLSWTQNVPELPTSSDSPYHFSISSRPNSSSCSSPCSCSSCSCCSSPRSASSCSFPRVPARLETGARARWGHLAVRAAEHAVTLSPTLFPFWMTLATALAFSRDYARALLVLNAAPYVPLSLPLYTKGLPPDVHQCETTEPPQQRSGCFSHLLLPPYDDDFWVIPWAGAGACGQGTATSLHQQLQECDEDGDGASQTALGDSGPGGYVSALAFLWSGHRRAEDGEERRHCGTGDEGQRRGPSSDFLPGVRPRQRSLSPDCSGGRCRNACGGLDPADEGRSGAGQCCGDGGQWGANRQEKEAGVSTAQSVSEGNVCMQGNAAGDDGDRKRETRGHRDASTCPWEGEKGNDAEAVSASPMRDGRPPSFPNFGRRDSAYACDGYRGADAIPTQLRHPREETDGHCLPTNAPYSSCASSAARPPASHVPSRRVAKNADSCVGTGDQPRAQTSQDTVLGIQPHASGSANHRPVSGPPTTVPASTFLSSLDRLNVCLNSSKGGRLDYFERKTFRLLSKIQRAISQDLLLVLSSRLFSPPRPLPPHLRWALTPAPVPLSTLDSREAGEGEQAREKARGEGARDGEGERGDRERGGEGDGERKAEEEVRGGSGISDEEESGGIKEERREELRGEPSTHLDASCNAGEEESGEGAPRASDDGDVVPSISASSSETTTEALPSPLRTGNRRTSSSSFSSPTPLFDLPERRNDRGHLVPPSTSSEFLGGDEMTSRNFPAVGRASSSSSSLSSSFPVAEDQLVVAKREEKREGRERVRAASHRCRGRRQEIAKRTAKEREDEAEEKVNELREWLDAQAPLLPESLLRPQSKMLEKVMRALESDTQLCAELQGQEEELLLLSELFASDANSQSLVEKAGAFLVARGSLCCRVGNWHGMCLSYGLALRLGLSCKASNELLRFFVRREAADAALRIACVTCQHLRRLCGEDFPSLPAWMSAALAKLVARVGVEAVQASFLHIPKCVRHPAVESFLESRRRAQAPHAAPFP